MKTEQIKLNSVKENPDNPRQIKNQNFERLVTSILAFPKMLTLRPIVVDDNLVILGGNMRMRALKEIGKMTAAEIAERLAKSVAFGKKSANEQIAIADHWEKWKSSPMVEVIRASELSEAEQKEFIIKDNAAFGEWDMDCLANGWDMQELAEYGVDLFENDEWNEEKKEEVDLSDDLVEEFKIEITCKDEVEQEKLYNRLKGEGLECRILTL